MFTFASREVADVRFDGDLRVRLEGEMEPAIVARIVNPNQDCCEVWGLFTWLASTEEENFKKFVDVRRACDWYDVGVTPEQTARLAGTRLGRVRLDQRNRLACTVVALANAMGSQVTPERIQKSMPEGCYCCVALDFYARRDAPVSGLQRGQRLLPARVPDEDALGNGLGGVGRWSRLSQSTSSASCALTSFITRS